MSSSPLSPEISLDVQEPVAASARVSSFKPVGAVVAGLAVLRYLAASPAPMPLSRITRDVGLNPSTCLNILRTLTQENYVSLDPHSKLYAMGLGALELVSGVLAHGGDLSSVRMLMDGISREESATVTLWRRISDHRMMLILEALPAGNVSIKMNIGQRLPLLIGAAGRLMAAFTRLSEAELRQQFRTLRLEQPMTFKEFQADVEQTIARGYAVDESHFFVGTSSVAVPVLNSENEATFALTATVFAARFTPEWAASMAQRLAKPAELLARAQPYL
ncbi:IclR family transcriptional regulator [Microvirga sp. SRT01]|uniref:IclR family transcriptional regulator n=1 Tax=Sphingomonas longa TaxID=2778730 RepID=A0ABS2DA75_9SPHN|nr:MULTISPECIES: IclR family transcriptional regulator [Alphaproteobacteria]MBM6577836.1 IclR family transcriptional regulator [Sphingomonas sp. BT552]MBR7710878.1 IclR family transcriptional regulator [Microvirga sp. SRT01]